MSMALRDPNNAEKISDSMLTHRKVQLEKSMAYLGKPRPRAVDDRSARNMHD